MNTIGKTLSKGDRVSLAGMRTSGMNGKKGTIVSLPDSSTEGRYGVRVDGSNKPVAIKHINILAADQESPQPIRDDATDLTLLQKGDRVTLFGLEASAFNGKQGIIVSLPTPSKKGRYGIRIDGMKKPIGVKPANIKALAKSTLELTKERDTIFNRFTPTEEECLDADQMAMMRLLSTTFLTEDNQIKAFGRKLQPMPDFRLEMINHGGGFPKSVDHRWANNHLRDLYEKASNLPHMFEVHFKMPDYKPGEKNLMRRLRTFDRSKLEWYFAGKPGDIFQNRIVFQHLRCLRYSYSNQAYRKEALHQGKTHVAIGFVDLGILMTSDIVGNKDSPLRFVGIDSSAYIVAKTHLIWELIKYAGSTVDAREKDSYQKYIAQVWFSTTWSEETESAVRAGLTSLNSRPGTEFETDVRLILEHWYNAPSISLKEARTRVQSLKTTASASIGKLNKRRDRIAVAKYILTGDFCVRDPTRGSLVLLDCPEGTPPPPQDETVFSALNFFAILQMTKKNPRWTVVDAAEKQALAGIAKLVSWCGSNRLSVEVKCSTVKDSIYEIASMKPWTMSWSNLLDYVDYLEFHRMARECSKHGDTIHFGYSMNWFTDVWGTVLIDFMGRENTELRKGLIEDSNKAIREMYRNAGCESYFRFPLPQNPINTVAKYLETEHYQKWTDHFFSYARRAGIFCNVGKVEQCVGSPLSSTGDSTISFTWTYDPNITFCPSK